MRVPRVTFLALLLAALAAALTTAQESSVPPVEPSPSEVTGPIFFTDVIRAGTKTLFTTQGNVAGIQQVTKILPASRRFIAG